MTTETEVLELGPGEGRAYSLGRMQAVFKADHGESADRYAVSEWWMEPWCSGPGAHQHEGNEELFYVLEGTASFFVDQEWRDLSKGSFLRIPAGIMHDFENRSDKRVGLLNIFLPGGFEQAMPIIAKWFEDHPQGFPGRPTANDR